MAAAPSHDRRRMEIVEPRGLAERFARDENLRPMSIELARPVPDDLLRHAAEPSRRGARSVLIDRGPAPEGGPPALLSSSAGRSQAGGPPKSARSGTGMANLLGSPYRIIPRCFGKPSANRDLRYDSRKPELALHRP